MLLQDIKDIKNGRIIAKDNDIVINIITEKEDDDDEIVPVEDHLYKEYMIKQDKETGDLIVYSPGGAIVFNCYDHNTKKKEKNDDRIIIDVTSRRNNKKWKSYL